jgi:hypothetical protein
MLLCSFISPGCNFRLHQAAKIIITFMIFKYSGHAWQRSNLCELNDGNATLKTSLDWIDCYRWFDLDLFRFFGDWYLNFSNCLLSPGSTGSIKPNYKTRIRWWREIDKHRNRRQDTAHNQVASSRRPQKENNIKLLS